MLERHPNPLASPVQIVRMILSLDDVVTPALMQAAAKLLCAAMGQVPGRVTRSAARSYLKELHGVAKTRRARRLASAAQAAMRAAALREAQERVREEANVARCERIRLRRAARGTHVAHTHREVDLLGRIHLS